MTDKKFEDLTSEEMKNLKIEFAPGCFDSFEGTQEELDDLVKEIYRMFESGEAQSKARLLDIDELDEGDIEMIEKLTSYEQTERKLQ